MSDATAHVVNVDDIQEIDSTRGAHWGGFDKPLTPSMKPRFFAALGVVCDGS